ncbi:putative ubiquitin thioesterase [Podospora fimiseda]|uniref:ubiquitinyl hydrolase 1 n=1 Tax=Podospora fimiseda TaxID=252190 RepID=A0AAN7BQ99_9PEZI|nr:putative ubiquitin thioesterase [Podospora fimiseda]
MYQHDSTHQQFQHQQYIQIGAGGYSTPQSLPQYTFEQTPLRLAGSVRSGGYGGSRIGSAGLAAADESVLYSPLFSTPPSADIGPASSSAGGSLNSFQNPHTIAEAPPVSLSIPVPASFPSQQLPLLEHHHHQHQQNFTNMDEINPDIIAQQTAAQEYEPPLVEGPPVGEKTPSTVITVEYAKADPVYVQKTQELPKTYSHYRPVRGDGNCGWRAIAFGYFETMAKSGNRILIESEVERLETLNKYIESMGRVADFVFTDMAQESLDLLTHMASVAEDTEKTQEILYQIFNTEDIANSIMYHIRLMASAYLRGHREKFGAFVSHPQGIEGYCTNFLERHSVEIEHLGIAILVEVLLKPAGITLEVAYLDRSPGNEVNTYRFPEEANGLSPAELGPMIYLLFRPDHYDILYRVESEPAPSDTSVTLQVHRVDISQNFEMAPTPAALQTLGPVDYNPLLLIPGYGDFTPGVDSVLDSSPSPLSAYSPSPVAPWVSSPFPDTPPPQTVPLAAPPSIPVIIPELIPSIPSTRLDRSKLSPLAQLLFPEHETPELETEQNPLRFSEYCQMPEFLENGTWREPNFQTSSFKNSHFNVAHYNNPNFQPEEYKPGEDDPPPRNTKKRASV